MAYLTEKPENKFFSSQFWLLGTRVAGAVKVTRGQWGRLGNLPTSTTLPLYHTFTSPVFEIHKSSKRMNIIAIDVKLSPNHVPKFRVRRVYFLSEWVVSMLSRANCSITVHYLVHENTV